MNSKKISIYLIFISLLFLVYYLVRSDYLVIPDQIRYMDLVFSFILLFFAMTVHGFTFSLVSSKFGLRISLLDSLRAFGIYVFTRYIPGKIWVVLGPISYYKNTYNYPLDKLVTVSLTSQFINLWVGISITSIVILFIDIALTVKILCLAAWVGLSLVIFTRYIHDLSEWLLKRFAKKDFQIPHISLRQYISLCPLFTIIWVLYTYGFYYLCMSFGADSNFMIFFAFPLASILGMIIVILPGGLGVREGVLVALLTASNVPIQLATTISMASRIWFLIGESFIFVVGLAVKLIAELKQARKSNG